MTPASSPPSPPSPPSGAQTFKPLAVHLPAQLEDAIRNHAREIYPHECCGILYGTDSATLRRVTDVQKADNAFDPAEKYHRFTISPETLLKAEKFAGANKLAVLGFYHSHPDHPARPSEYDRTHGWPYYSYMIVSVEKGTPAALTSWQLDPASEQFSQEEVIVT